MASYSSSVKSPSGPTQTQIDSGERPWRARKSSKYTRGYLLPGRKEATSDSSNFSRLSKNSDGATGGSIFGSHGAPHCLIDSMATVRHFSSFFDTSFFARSGTERA